MPFPVRILRPLDEGMEDIAAQRILDGNDCAGRLPQFIRQHLLDFLGKDVLVGNRHHAAAPTDEPEISRLVQIAEFSDRQELAVAARLDTLAFRVSFEEIGGLLTQTSPTPSDMLRISIVTSG